MPKSTDWGEPKENQTLRITPTAKQGLNELAESLGITPTEMIERIGRAAKDAGMQRILWAVLTSTIMQMQNKRGVKRDKGQRI